MKKINFIKSGLVLGIVTIASAIGFSTAFGYGGGGGGGSYNPSCASLVYGGWGECINGVQYRNVTSQTPSNCNLNAAEQLARSKSCEVGNGNNGNGNGNGPKKVLGAKVYNYADGTLLKGTGPKIYVVINGELIHVLNLEQLAKYKGKILKVADSELDPSTASNTTPTVLGVKNYADGTLLRAKGDVKIYVIKAGKKIHVLNLEELRKYRGPVLAIEANDLNNY